MNQSALPQHRFNFGGGLVLLMGMIIPVIIMAFANVAAMFLFHKNYQYRDEFLVISNALMWLGTIAAYDFIICRQQTGKPLNFNFKVKNLSDFVIIIPMMTGMILVAEFFTSKIPVTGPFFGEMYEFFARMIERMTNDFISMILLAVIMAPLFEEIVFRGIIQKGLINNGVKPINAIIIAAVIFGLVHGNPWQFVGAVLLGIVMGIVYDRTGSLLLPIILHAFNNLIGTLLYYYTDTESIAIALNVSEFLLLAVGIVLFFVFYTLLNKKYPSKNTEIVSYERNIDSHP